MLQNKLRKLEQHITSFQTVIQLRKKSFANENRGRGNGGVRCRGSNRKSDSVRHKWSESGHPICSYCNKEGHIMKNCWKLQRNQQNRENSSKNQ